MARTSRGKECGTPSWVGGRREGRDKRRNTFDIRNANALDDVACSSKEGLQRGVHLTQFVLSENYFLPG